ncbi:MAG: hypothetical protein KA586_02090 [Candidatus Promineofilum sp.]|nr:hypothetical protein [Promineifilum sp.]
MRHQLDVQSQQINRVLNHHRVPATITGGLVRSRLVSFDLQTQIAAGLERILGLKRDLGSALGVGDVGLTRDDGRWRLQVPRPDDAPVPLFRLMAETSSLSPMSIPIGVDEEGQSVLLSFSGHRHGHVLIAGEVGAGKTSLLRTIATALALTSRQAQCQLQILDPSWDGTKRLNATDFPLLPLGYLPPMLTDPAFGMEACASLIHFLAEEMTYRRRERMTLPRIVILLDHVVAYLEGGVGEGKNDLYRLLQYGAQAGIHLVLAADRPDSPLLDSTLKASLTMRLVGRLGDPLVARRVAGIPLEKATLLYGEGDFLAVAGEDVTYFQAAYLSDYELHHQLTELNRSARPVLLAQPYSTRLRIKDKPAKASPASRIFTMHDGDIELDTNRPDSGEDPSEKLPF